MVADTNKSGSRPKVLIVDDQRALRDVLEIGLETEFEVEVASSAEEGELLLATGDHDVVVCDHLMPRTLGLDFLIAASQRHPRTKRILLTGYMNPEFLARSMSVAKLSACLMKPVSRPDLIAEIRTALVDAI